MMLCLVFFAFTTILGWNYYGERCMEYLFGGKKKAVSLYRYLYIVAIAFGPYMTVSAVWTIADIFNGLMAIPNLIALLSLNKVVANDTDAYILKLKRAQILKKLRARRT
jgi:AGCS family alanine or glycine:cation symporter